MAKFIGTVRRTDLEGGAWTLVTDQGVVYQLQGGNDALLVDGKRAEIDGDLAADQVGLAMVGDVLRIKDYRLL